MRLLLLSGGLDSTAVAAWLRPELCLTINYGQRAAAGEARAAQAVCRSLGLTWARLEVDCGAVGSGLLLATAPSQLAPDEEWWPYRNQLLLTLAGAWGLTRGVTELLLGCVRDDASHVDGRPEFLATADALFALQEGRIRVVAPAAELTSAQLLERSCISRGTVGWTHSCNRASLACGTCPSCERRARVLQTCLT